MKIQTLIVFVLIALLVACGKPNDPPSDMNSNVGDFDFDDPNPTPTPNPMPTPGPLPPNGASCAQPSVQIGSMPAFSCSKATGKISINWTQNLSVCSMNFRNVTGNNTQYSCLGQQSFTATVIQGQTYQFTLKDSAVTALFQVTIPINDCTCP